MVYYNYAKISRIKSPVEKIRQTQRNSYEKMAVELDCTPGYLAVIAHGTRQPSPKFALKIEKEFGIPRTKLRPDIWQ